LLQTVIVIVSFELGSPQSLMITCSVAPPSTGTGSSGFVMSRMLTWRPRHWSTG